VRRVGDKALLIGPGQSCRSQRPLGQEQPAQTCSKQRYAPATHYEEQQQRQRLFLHLDGLTNHHHTQVSFPRWIRHCQRIAIDLPNRTSCIDRLGGRLACL